MEAVGPRLAGPSKMVWCFQRRADTWKTILNPLRCESNPGASVILPLRLSSISRLASVRTFTAIGSVLALGLVSQPASARKFEMRRHPRVRAVAHAFVNAALPGLGLMPIARADGDMPADGASPADAATPVEGKKYELKFARQGGELIDVVYRVGDTYIPEALDKLDHFLRDSHNEQVTKFDPRTFDLLHTVLAKVDKAGSVINVLSAYRSQETNDALRASHTTNAAEHSQHIEAKAVDVRVEGVPAARLRDAALSLDAGGVGFYPKSQFVHVDVGPVRQWTYAPHARKAKHRRRRA